MFQQPQSAPPSPLLKNNSSHSLIHTPKDDDEISDTSTIYNALEVAPSHVEVIDEMGTFIFSFIDIM